MGTPGRPADRARRRFPCSAPGRREQRETARVSARSRSARIPLTDDPRRGRLPYHQVVNPMATRLADVPRSRGARVAPPPPRRQELLADAGLGVALAAVNVVALLP